MHVCDNLHPIRIKARVCISVYKIKWVSHLKKKKKKSRQMFVPSSEDLFRNSANWLIMLFLLDKLCSMHVICAQFDSLCSQIGRQRKVFYCKCQENAGLLLSGLHSMSCLQTACDITVFCIDNTIENWSQTMNQFVMFGDVFPRVLAILLQEYGRIQWRNCLRDEWLNK